MTNFKAHFGSLGPSNKRQLGFKGLLMQLVPAKDAPEQGFYAHTASTASALSPSRRKSLLWKTESDIDQHLEISSGRLAGHAHSNDSEFQNEPLDLEIDVSCSLLQAA